MAASVALGQAYLKHGFRMIATGTDQGMLQEATRAMLDGMRN
jgi:2-keto-3-deoxy-L-rhamnonate aldolase RhmA